LKPIDVQNLILRALAGADRTQGELMQCLPPRVTQARASIAISELQGQRLIRRTGEEMTARNNWMGRSTYGLTDEGRAELNRIKEGFAHG